MGCYRAMRAEPPFMTRSTSGKVAMLVSPGVRHGQRAMGNAAADGPFDGLAREDAVDQARSKGIATADAIKNFDVALRHEGDLVLIERHGAPGIARGGVRGAQGGRHQFQVRIRRSDIAQHLLVAGDGQLGEIFGDVLERNAEHRGEVLFVAEQHIDFADQFAIDFLRFRLAPDAFPERVAVVQVVGDRRAVPAGGVHRLRCRRRVWISESAAKMPPVWNQRAPWLGAEDLVPIPVAGLCLGNGRMAAVGAAGGRAHAETALGKVESVAHGAPDAVVRKPAQQRQDRRRPAASCPQPAGPPDYPPAPWPPPSAARSSAAARAPRCTRRRLPTPESAAWCGCALPPGSSRSMTSPRLTSSQRVGPSFRTIASMPHIVRCPAARLVPCCETARRRLASMVPAAHCRQVAV